MEKIIVFSAPSGSGKTTIINKLLGKYTQMEYAVSATTREPRTGEIDGVSYYFIPIQDFKKHIDLGDFIEWEEVYSGSLYGVLKSEVNRLFNKGKIIVFDVDVKGALNIKKLYPNALLIFIIPPSIEVLKERLIKRSTDSLESINRRLDKAEIELKRASEFDYVLRNDNLEDSIQEIDGVIKKYIDFNLIPDSFKYF